MAEAAKPAAKKSADEKPLTPEDFITKWPLYTPFEYESFGPPGRISFRCGQCGKETTWALMETERQYMQRANATFIWTYYTCTLCESRYLVVMYREVAFKKGEADFLGRVPAKVVTTVQKIGQYPSLSIDIPRLLEKNLGEASSELYKKALINRNEGNGLAAVTYIRRVVEDKTDELIEVVADLAESHNVDPAIVAKIRAAKDERTTYDHKLEIAATVLPASLVPDGVNPLGSYTVWSASECMI